MDPNHKDPPFHSVTELFFTIPCCIKKGGVKSSFTYRFSIIILIHCKLPLIEC